MEIKHFIGIAHHCLHLCTDANIEETVFSYVMEADVFVTNNSEVWENKFKEHEIECRIKRPGVVKSKERIVVDGSSLGNYEQWEKKWEKQPQVVCVYNIDNLDPSSLKDLVKVHDKMILSTDKIKMLSDKHLKREISNLNPEMVENLVKRELKNIVVSLLLSKPMCGTDLVKALYEKFKVFISSGMLYPALHELEKKGLLKYEYKFKNKVYSIQEQEEAKNLLKNQIKANSLLSQILIVD